MMKAIVELTHFDTVACMPAKLVGTQLYAVFEIFDACVPDAGGWLEHGAFGATGNQVYMDITRGRAIEVVAKGLFDPGGARTVCLLC